MGKIADRIYACEPWRIVETGWTREKNPVGESIFSQANEYMGFRNYAEEGADAPGLIGTYFGGVYEWNEEAGPGGYLGIIKRPHHMVCAADFFHTRIFSGQERIRLDERASDYERILDLRTGLVHRAYTVQTAGGAKLRLTFDRLLSMDAPSCAVQRITLTADRETSVRLELAVNGGIPHQSAGRCQWTKTAQAQDDTRCGVRYRTETTDQTVEYLFSVSAPSPAQDLQQGNCTGLAFDLMLKPNVPALVERRILNTVMPSGSLDLDRLNQALSFDEILQQNTAHWAGFWRVSDVEITGDDMDQQGIRYCLFQLHQTYRGLDGHHNIGAKGLTGEAYSGHAFWDSETYCLPYYLYNDPRAAKSLLLFRYHTLPQARERAVQLDCEGACYPIATINGYESCALWQHASLQMQPSTAVAHGIMEYARLTGDDDFLFHEGIEMLTEISRYVVSRGAWNADHTGFGFWGVMGPDEFHMMVNNDYYTNYMGRRTLRDTLEVLERTEDPDAWASPEERRTWRDISEHIILHRTVEGVFEQHDGYFTMPHLDIHSIPVTDFPLYEHWSYDRIYRTDMIKQPDVLMAMFLHPEDFSDPEVAANYDFYEPRCIHESSLSPSIHAILAQRLGRDQAAADFFGFATRLDLDNYNRNTAEGLHLTSIAAAWVTIVFGFGGLHEDHGMICLAPHLPEGWKSYSFRFRAGDGVVLVRVDENGAALSMLEGTRAEIRLYGEQKVVTA